MQYPIRLKILTLALTAFLGALSAQADEGGSSPLKDGTYIIAVASCYRGGPGEAAKLQLEMGKEMTAKNGKYTFTGRIGLEIYRPNPSGDVFRTLLQTEIITRAVSPTFLWNGPMLDTKLYFDSGVGAHIEVIKHASGMKLEFEDCAINDFTEFHHLADPNGELEPHHR